MSSTNSVSKAMNAAAKVNINGFMNIHDAENIKKLQTQIIKDEAPQNSFDI